MRHAVIMAGGSGTRLWPVSRKNAPKQFQKLIGDKTLIQQTYERIIRSVPAENIWVVTNKDHVDQVKAQLPEISPKQILAEPTGRNTTAATGLAMLRIAEIDPHAIAFGLLPADHFIGQEKVFTETTNAIFSFLESHPEYVVTIGINPTRPDTGLGYIQMSGELAVVNKQRIFKVESFHEKPSQEKAQQFLERWEYLWNGGYYLFNVAQMIEYYRRLAPETLEKLEEFCEQPTSQAIYESIPSEPIDKTIAERLEMLAVAPADLEWSDVGNWATLHEVLGLDGELGQVVVGKHIGISSKKSLIFGKEKLIATVGLDNIIVVETDDAVLIADRNAVQDVKKVVEELQKQNKTEYL